MRQTIVDNDMAINNLNNDVSILNEKVATNDSRIMELSLELEDAKRASTQLDERINQMTVTNSRLTQHLEITETRYKQIEDENRILRMQVHSLEQEQSNKRENKIDTPAYPGPSDTWRFDSLINEG